MGKQLRPVMLLAEINDAVRLNAHTEAGADRCVALERRLSGRTRCPVLTARSEDDEGGSTSRERPVTLHSKSSGVIERGGERGGEQAAVNICKIGRASCRESVEV